MRTTWTVWSAVTVEPEEFDSLDAEQLSNGKYVWVHTSESGACHQGPKQYKRPADALRAGRSWLATQKLS
jgi:hypothetical protein